MSQDDVVGDFPFNSWKPMFGPGASLLQQLGDTLKGKSGTVDTKTALAGKDAIGFYFSAHWCGPCRAFTPKLAGKYEELKKAGKNFEIIFISSDRDDSSFNEYHGTHPWLALPFSERKRKEQLSDFYGVQGIPTLVILGADGKVINKNARGALMQNDVVSNYPFHPKPMNDLSESLDGINDNASLVIMMERCSQATKDSVSATLMAIASAEQKKPANEKRAGLFFTGCGGGPVEVIRSKCSLGNASDTPQMLILNLDDQGAVYKPSQNGPVNEETINAFLDAYKAGSLTRSQFGG